MIQLMQGDLPWRSSVSAVVAIPTEKHWQNSGKTVAKQWQNVAVKRVCGGCNFIGIEFEKNIYH